LVRDLRLSHNRSSAMARPSMRQRTLLCATRSAARAQLVPLRQMRELRARRQVDGGCGISDCRCRCVCAPPFPARVCLLKCACKTWRKAGTRSSRSQGSSCPRACERVGARGTRAVVRCAGIVRRRQHRCGCGFWPRISTNEDLIETRCECIVPRAEHEALGNRSLIRGSDEHADNLSSVKSTLARSLSEWRLERSDRSRRTFARAGMRRHKTTLISLRGSPTRIGRTRNRSER